MLDEVFFYTGTNADFVNELFSYSTAVHPLIWANASSNYNPLLAKGRRFFVQLGYANRNSSFLTSVVNNGFLLQYNMLNEFDEEIAAGNFVKVDELINLNHPASMIQTDNAIPLINYLKTKGRRN